MDTECSTCKLLAGPKHEILETESWSVYLRNNHSYFGRAFVTLRTHKGSLSELNEQEWQEFHEIVRRLERAYKEAFGADPINWGSYMNHAFRNEPHNPHVHWHAVPRYEIAPVFEGMTYDDPLFGEFYDEKAQRMVDDETVDRIAAQLKTYL